MPDEPKICGKYHAGVALLPLIDRHPPLHNRATSSTTAQSYIEDNTFMFNEVPELLTQVSDGLWRAIADAVFQLVEHWHHQLDECKRKGYMTERQKINNTVTVSMLLNRLKAEIERLADPDSRKPTSNTQWKPFGKLNCATKGIVKNPACRQVRSRNSFSD
jgi:hypothetical protein